MKTPDCHTCPNQNPLFCGLKGQEKSSLEVNKRFMLYKKGEVIFTEGKKVQGLYCIYSGKAKLAKRGEEGRDVITRLMNEGEVLGYRALLGDEAYDATATALEDSYICRISRKVFLEAIKHNPALAFKVIAKLAHDLKQSEENILFLSQATVHQRIIRILLLLQEQFGFEEDGISLAIRLTRREIAEMAGTTTESAIRTLSELEKEKLIELVGKRILLPDTGRLQQEMPFI